MPTELTLGSGFENPEKSPSAKSQYPGDRNRDIKTSKKFGKSQNLGDQDRDLKIPKNPEEISKNQKWKIPKSRGSGSRFENSEKIPRKSRKIRSGKSQNPRDRNLFFWDIPKT